MATKSNRIDIFDMSEISTTTNKDHFTINGCGKFSETKKHLTKAEAAILYYRLGKWLNIK